MSLGKGFGPIPHAPCYVYVDGQYVREALRQSKFPDEFDPWKTVAPIGNQRIAGHLLDVVRLFFYDALDPEGSEEEQKKQRAYFARLGQLPDTHVVFGEVRRGVRRREQKGVDVQLAVDALRVANAGLVRAIALVTGDADFAPLARAIREAGPHVIVVAFSDSLSKSLRLEADRVHLWSSMPTDWILSQTDA